MKIDFSDKKTRTLLITLLVLLAVTVGAGIYYLTGSGSSVAVDDFTGKTKADVEAWRTASKLSEERVIYDYQYDEEQPVDTVLDQSVPGGSRLKSSSTLTITLSNGIDPDKEFTMPDFTGQSQTEVSQWFQENQFSNVTYEFQADQTVAKDIFLKISPSDATLKRSTAITVTISSGSDGDQADVTVPDFSAYTKANIQAWASTNSITAVFTTQASDTIASGKVISQSVKAGTIVKGGSKITIVLSSGKGISVVSYVGKTKAEAAAWISTNNLKAVYQEVYDETIASGSVVSQTPSSGTVSEAASITFRISVGWVPVENYTGKTRSEITSYISWLNTQKNSTARITLTVSEQESSETAGKILSQSLNGTEQSGTSYTAPGGTVTVVVAVGRKAAVESKTGSSESDFRSYLDSIGMSVGSISYSYSDSVSEGCIISNTTGTFAAGSSISYTVSKGAYTPDSAWYAPGAEYNALASYISSANASGAGWSVSRSSEGSPVYSAGQIIACSVSGKSISCQVSSGKTITVTNVLGKQKEDAKSILENQGLSVSLISAGYNDAAAGTILGQNPSGGSAVSEGSSVTLTYSAGPAPVTPCPSGSTGSVPACVCSDPTTDYNSGSNSCEVTKGLMPNIEISSFDGENESNLRSRITSILNAAGFYHLNFVALSSETDNPNQYKGLKSIYPTADGSSYVYLDTTITITYFTTEQ